MTDDPKWRVATPQVYATEQIEQARLSVDGRKRVAAYDANAFTDPRYAAMLAKDAALAALPDDATPAQVEALGGGCQLPPCLLCDAPIAAGAELLIGANYADESAMDTVICAACLAAASIALAEATK